MERHPAFLSVWYIHIGPWIFFFTFLVIHMCLKGYLLCISLHFWGAMGEFRGYSVDHIAGNANLQI